jgi:hypothetical protein
MLKTVSKEVKKFIPSSEISDPKPTTIFYRAMSKGDYEKYSSSLMEFKKGRLINKADKSYEYLLQSTLTANADGVFILNAMVDGVATDEIKDKDKAIQFLLNMEDLLTASEIEGVLRGVSIMSDEETKNSGTPSEPV